LIARIDDADYMDYKADYMDLKWITRIEMKSGYMNKRLVSYLLPFMNCHFQYNFLILQHIFNLDGKSILH